MKKKKYDFEFNVRHKKNMKSRSNPISIIGWIVFLIFCIIAVWQKSWTYVLVGLILLFMMGFISLLYKRGDGIGGKSMSYM